MIKVHPMTGYAPKHSRGWPIRKGGATGRVGYFGPTRLSKDGVTPKMHNGIDFLAPNGSNIYAMHDGTVSRFYGMEQKHGKGYGKRFYLNAKDNPDIVSLYAHLSVAFVAPGDFVRVGDCIGKTGRSGNMKFDPSNIPDHAHIGIQNRGEWIDPLWFLGLGDENG